MTWTYAHIRGNAEESGSDQWIKTVYNENNGLDTGEANVVLQTMDGYIWVGSYGGLLRYNGREFENFSTGDHAAGSSSIRALYEDESGRLFIGTNDVGVYLYENGSFTRVPCADGDTGYYSIRSFCADQDGNVYVGTTSGLARIVSADGTLGAVEEDFSGANLVPVEGTGGLVVYDLTCDDKGVIWGCADNSQLLLVEDGELTGILSAEVWLENDCYSVFCASDGCIYLGSGGNEVMRLHRLGEGYTAADFETDKIDTGDLYAVNRFYETEEGIIWGLCDNGIAWISENNAFQTPDEMAGMISCCSMIVDYEGNIWVASSRTGLTFYSEGKFYNYNNRGGLEGIAVNAILRQDGMTYLGTDSGLILLDEDYYTVENELTELMEGKRVRHISCDSSGTFWFCVYGTGLVQYTPGDDQIRLLTEEDGLLGNQVRLTLERSDGTIAVAGSSGINILQDGEVVQSYGSEVLAYPFILCMYEAEDGTLVAGSDGEGIYEISPDGEVTQYYKEDGLASGTVMRMTPDADAGVWISAGSSLYYRDEDGIREVELTESVGSVLDILVIDDEVWLMKSSGLLIADRKDLLAGTASLRTLSTEYGLTGTLVANSWNWLDEEERLWLCTNNGISVIDTEEIPTNEQEPRGAISKVTVDGVEMAVTDSLTVSASATRVTFELSVLSFTPGDKTVEYMLEGFDKEISKVSASSLTAVSYTNLNGGDYIFHFMVCNEDGVEGSEITIEIHKGPHFWETSGFLAMVLVALIVLVLLVIWLVTQIRLRSMKKRQEELKLIIEQSLHTFANAIDAKDSDTNGHSVRVANYSREIARRMNFSEEEQEQISYMALLHDIGKIGIPDSILKKSGKLTKEEWEVVKNHPRIGGEILSEFTVIPDIADGAKYHHEHYDGTGYCEGLKGEDIPLKARIIAIADSFDAMCSTRHYQTGNTLEYAREELLRCGGTQFDPNIVGYMVDMIDDGYVKRV